MKSLFDEELDGGIDDLATAQIDKVLIFNLGWYICS